MCPSPPPPLSLALASVLSGIVGNTYINGLLVDVTSPAFNFFKVLKTVRKELRFQDQLAALPIAPSFLPNVAAAFTRIIAVEVGARVQLPLAPLAVAALLRHDWALEQTIGGRGLG
jgi:hypothetical protein